MMMLEQQKITAKNRQKIQQSLPKCFNLTYTKLISLFSISALLFMTSNCQDAPNYPEIWEQDVVSGNSLGDKSFGYFQMTISERYFTGVESLAIKVTADSFGSDPDLFISKTNTQPTSSFDSQWYCVKKGSDTCIIKPNEISTYDVLYIGVRCITPCDFTLSSDYFTVVTLDQDTTTQYRLDGDSANLFEYYVPQDASDGFTRAVTFTIVAEDSYSPINVYFSLDDSIYIIEERQMENLISNGAGYYFTEQDYGWCTRCYVYFYVEIKNPGRYYITTKASARNPVISTDKVAEKFVNRGQQDCFQYFVQSEVNDLLMNLKHYQGSVDFYLAGQSIPSGPGDSGIRLMGSRAPQMQIILTAADRSRIGFKTGLYETCIYGYMDSSVAITPSEQNTGGRLQADDGVVYTFNLQNKSSLYFRYTSDFLSQKANLTLRMEGLSINTSATTIQVPPRVYYKICASTFASECLLSSAERTGSGMTEITKYDSNVRIGQINHDPSKCPSKSSSTAQQGCFYLISVYYPDSSPAIMRTSFTINSYLQQSQAISMDDQYRNVLVQGQYFYYQLQPGNSVGYGYLDSLKINLESLVGDADLVVSTSTVLPRIEDSIDNGGSDNGTWTSRQTERYEAITLQKGDNFTLNRTLYIGVYASSRTAYQLSFEPVYSVTYQKKLEHATPLSDSQPVPVEFLQETEEIFFSYMPWWSMSENRTIVLVADVIFNSIFFYAKPNDFPQFYTTDLQDQNDIIAIPPEQYKKTDVFYIRARPDFALYDLISSRQYIFNFIAFSQVQTTPENGKLIDLHLFDQQYGYANQSSNFYRHLLLDKNSTINVTVTAIKGNPVLLIKLANSPSYPMSVDPSTYDVRVDNQNGNIDFFRLDPNWRYDQNIYCDRAGYPSDGGNTVCTMFIAVECADACVYQINLQMEGRENMQNKPVPTFLTDQNYFTGSVAYNETKYFYYPISTTTGDTVFFLNKTGPAGQNGDSLMMIYGQADAASYRLGVNQTNFDSWTFPTTKTAKVVSQSGSASSPEIIELCPSTYDMVCGNTSCVIIVGVQGTTPNVVSHFRLIAYSAQGDALQAGGNRAGMQRLYDKSPIKGNIQNAGDYVYYWFSSNTSAITPKAYWEYVVAVSVEGANGKQQQDVDLFVSAVDGRYPSSEDYDFKSDNLGPDDIYITSTDDFWINNGYNKAAGIVFVVGVKALTNNANFTVLMAGPSRFQYDYTILQSSWITYQFPKNTNQNNNYQVYRWYNWGQRDFKISVDVMDGSIQAYMNIYSERTFRSNGYLSIPINQNNSLWYGSGTTGMTLGQRILKDDPVMFCYYCWYFITVRTNWTNQTSQYRVSMTAVPDGGEEVPIIGLYPSVMSISLPSTGSTLQRRFILDQKETFTLTATINSGQANMYVTLFPGQSSKYLWSGAGSVNNPITLSVKQSDSNFHIGAYYYVIVQSTSGKVDMQLQLQQKRNVKQIQSGGFNYKVNYYTAEERVKLFYFIAPKARQWFRNSILIQSFTKDFYPTVLVYKNTFANPVTNPNATLAYPNLSNYTFMMGDNFTQVAQQNEFNFTFKDSANASFTYYTIAVYSWSYGLTDERKHEFKLSLQTDQISSPLNMVDEEPSSYFSTKKYFSLPFLKDPDMETVIEEKEDEFIDEAESFIEHAQSWTSDRIQEIKDYFNGMMKKQVKRNI